MSNQGRLPEDLVCPIDGTPIAPWVIGTDAVSRAEVDKMQPLDLPMEEIETLIFKCGSSHTPHRFNLGTVDGERCWTDLMTGRQYPVTFRDGPSGKKPRS